MRFAILVFVSLLCFGCSHPTSNKVTLRIASWSGAGEDNDYYKLVDQIYRDFEKANPDIQIVIENMPGDYVPKMMLSKIADVVPDVAVLDASSAALFVKNGVLQDLTEYIAKDSEFKTNQFFENTLQAGTYQGKLYSIPVDFTPMVMYYNKDLFDKAGVAYPKNGWTFEDFEKSCAQLKAKEIKGFVVSAWMPGWVMWLWNNGGDVLNSSGIKASGSLDASKNVETIQFLKGLVDQGYAPTLSAVAASGVDPFANGEVAMAVNGHWAITGYKSAKGINWKHLGIVSMPTRLKSPVTVYYEAGLGIGNGCKNPEAAWKFIKHFTSYQNQLRYNSSGIAICARKDVAQERAKEPIEADFVQLIQGSRPPMGASVEGYAFVEQQGQKMMESVLNGRLTPQQALSEMAKRVDREFAK
jgi:multiple sugar transport system substrate-binding protein